MLTIKKVLFAADFSEPARSRLAYARSIAGRVGAELHVFHADVLHGEQTAPTAGPAESIVAELKRMAEAAAEERGQPEAVPVRYAVERNITAAPAILEYAEKEDVDLIVLGTHGRRGVQRLVLGSVAEEVVRFAKCPVLTVRVPGLTAEPSWILVPIDFSTHSRQALLHARELALIFDASLDLLHVVEETLHPAFYGILVGSVYDVDPDIETKAIDRMREMVEEIGMGRIRVSYHAGPGSAARKIADFAEKKRSSMIVMGTHGLTGLEHFLIGSTTERVVRRASCPVLAIKSFGRSILADEACSEDGTLDLDEALSLPTPPTPH